MSTALLGTEHYVYRSDGRIFAHQVGAGNPAILLHAVGSSGETWSPVLDKLARHITCYNIDLPGHDHSDMPLRQYSVEDYAAALIDVMDGLGLEKPDLIGDHTGALLSVVLAGKYPDRVNRVVLDGLPCWDPKRGRAIWEKFFVPRFTDTSSYPLPVDPLLTWNEAAVKTPGLVKATWERANYIHDRSRLWERMTHEKTTSFDAVSAAADVKRPTLLMYGDGDILLWGAKTANEKIKGSVLKVIPDTPGTVHTVRPELFVQEAIEFLKA